MEQCTAKIVFADDYGENLTTFCCQLEAKHKGNHIEQGIQYGSAYELAWGDMKKDIFENIPFWDNIRIIGQINT